jgi:hypothetical protein
VKADEIFLVLLIVVQNASGDISFWGAGRVVKSGRRDQQGRLDTCTATI